MRQDVYNEVKRQMNQDIKINCSEIARRFNCDPRAVRNYIKGKSPTRKPVVKPSILDDYKDIIIDKIDNFELPGRLHITSLRKKVTPN